MNFIGVRKLVWSEYTSVNIKKQMGKLDNYWQTMFPHSGGHFHIFHIPITFKRRENAFIHFKLNNNLRSRKFLPKK